MIHIVELGGTGGVYQHAVALANTLAQDERSVTLHTASDREIDPHGVTIDEACDWRPHLSSGLLRRLLFVRDIAIRMWPGLIQDLKPGDVVHVEGALLLPLTALFGRLVRRRGARLIVSPHNTFARRGFRPLGNAGIRWSCRLADEVLVYSQEDRNQVKAWGGTTVTISPLLQYMPAIDPTSIQDWRNRWLGGRRGRVLLAPGYMRPDKGIDELVQAFAAARRSGAQDLRLAIIGEDAGGATIGRNAANREGVEVAWSLDYLPLPSFAAAIAAADAIVLAHKVASQSGVLRIARQLGVPTIVPDTGGLSEEGDVVYPRGDVSSLAAAMATVRTREMGPASTNSSDGKRCLEAHLSAYRLLLGP